MYIPSLAEISSPLYMFSVYHSMYPYLTYVVAKFITRHLSRHLVGETKPNLTFGGLWLGSEKDLHNIQLDILQ